MEATSGNRNIIDIKQSVCKNKDIVQSLLVVHAVSGCDTTGRFHGIGKGTFLKYLRVGLKLCHLGKLDSDFNLLQNECTLLVSSCYGFPSESMTDCRIKTWYSKTAKARTKAPELKSLPPTSSHLSKISKGVITSVQYGTRLWTLIRQIKTLVTSVG